MTQYGSMKAAARRFNASASKRSWGRRRKRIAVFALVRKALRVGGHHLSIRFVEAIDARSRKRQADTLRGAVAGEGPVLHQRQPAVAGRHP